MKSIKKEIGKKKKKFRRERKIARHYFQHQNFLSYAKKTLYQISDLRLLSPTRSHSSPTKPSSWAPIPPCVLKAARESCILRRRRRCRCPRAWYGRRIRGSKAPVLNQPDAAAEPAAHDGRSGDEATTAAAGAKGGPDAGEEVV